MKRRKAREYALQFLYRIDFIDILGNPDRIAQLKDALVIFWADIGEKAQDVKVFAEELILGTLKELDSIDALIQKTAAKWDISRIATVDKNIIRFAVYELLFRKDIPPAVSINEALEIAKKYSAVESSAFINGILDRIAHEHKK